MAVAQRDRYARFGSGGLFFINVQKERALSTQTDKTALITYDSKQLKDLQFEDLGASETGDSIVKSEGAALSIRLKDLLEILKADSVTARFGAVVYRLDKDNIAAFHYLAEQIEKDSKPVPKRKARVKANKKRINRLSKATGASHRGTKITAKKGTIEHLAQTISAAFEEGTLSRLDAQKPYLNTVLIVIEDTLSDGKTSKKFKTLKAGIVIERNFGAMTFLPTKLGLKRFLQKIRTEKRTDCVTVSFER